jgi:hypothetical protein
MRNRISHFVLRGVVLAASLGLAAWALLTMHWQGDLIELFPADLPAVRDLRALQERGGENFSLLGVVVDPGAEDSAQLAAHLAKVADALAASPLVAKAEVLSDPSRLAPEGWASVFIGLPPEKFAQFAQATSEAAIHARLQAAREALSGWPDPAVWARIHYDPLGLADWVMSAPSSNTTGAPPAAPNPILSITPKIRANTLATAAPLVTAVRAALADNGFAPGRIALTGEAAYVAEIATQMRREMIEMTLSSGALIALVFLIAYRSWFPLVALFALQAAGLFAGLLVARIVWGSINLLSVAFASVALGLCSDYGAVVYHHFAQGGRREGKTWQTLRRSLIFCVLTTAVGLGGLAASALPGLRQFAVLINVCLLVVAALAMGPWARWVEHHLGARALASAQETEPEQPAPVWLRGAGWIFLVGGWMLLGWAGLHLKNIYDFSWARMSPPGLEAQRGQDILSAYMPAKFITGDESAWAANRQTWAARTSFALEPVFTAEGFQPRLAEPYQNLFHALDDWSHGDPGLEIWSRGSTAFARLQSTLPAMIKSNVLATSACAAVIILALLAWSMGSIANLFYTLLAMAAGVGWWLAGLVAVHEPLSLAAFASLPILFGLGEDFCIFIMLFIRQEGQRWRTARRRLGQPLALVAIITVIGFGTSGFSAQPALRNFGVVLALGVLSSFLAAALGLPALLSRRTPKAK